MIKTPKNLELVTDAPSRKRLMTGHPMIRQLAVDAVLVAMSRLSGKNSLRVTYGLRTFAEQDRLFNKGRDASGKKIGPVVTNARGGQSYHNYGLAFDFVLMHNDGKISYNLREDLDEDGISDWREVALSFKEFGFEWGGEWNFRDNPHVQLIPAEIVQAAKKAGIKPWAYLKKLYDSGQKDQAGYVFFGGYVG